MSVNNMIVNHFRIPKQKYEEKRKKQIFSVTLQSLSGGVAEWSMAAVLKTVVPKGTGGSNPSASAKMPYRDVCGAFSIFNVTRDVTIGIVFFITDYHPYAPNTRGVAELSTNPYLCLDFV